MSIAMLTREIPDSMTKPRLLLIGGPNGAGKTTVALQYATVEGLPYLGADEIAASLNPSAPETVGVAAGRQFLRTIDEFIAKGESCVVESTMSGRTIRKRIVEATAHGYEVTIVFVFVDSPDVCVARVAQRVRKGGHHVPEADIRRRYVRSIRNFWSEYRSLADRWTLLYNGGEGTQTVSAGSPQQITIRDQNLHTTFLESLELHHE